jgi:hypothetical protein
MKNRTLERDLLALLLAALLSIGGCDCDGGSGNSGTPDEVVGKDRPQSEPVGDAGRAVE